MDIGNTIKKIRMRTGKSQEEFAYLCDITQNFLSRIESNQQHPKPATFKKICDNIGIPLPILFLLSMNEDDIPVVKKKKFKKIEPDVNRLVTRLKKFYKIYE